MWTLTSIKTGSVYYLLSEKERHLVGRSSADLILAGDTSISRSHACLYPGKDSVKAIDIDSKYGTFYNENIDNKVPMAKNVAVELKNGERIQFGMLGNEWILSKLNICSLTSTLTVDHRAEMTKILKSLDARSIDIWEQSCTHLTMSEITVTLKVLRALVENIPIVSIEFWRQYLVNLRAGQVPPKPANFLPKCAESFINPEDVSFGFVPARKTLFAGKTFVFMSGKPYERYKPIIISAGGICENLYKGVSKAMLAKKEVIVIRCASATQTQNSQVTVDSICDYIKTKGRRLIPDAEIGLAILHCCTKKYCNPAYNVINEFAAETNDVLPCRDVIAKETPRDNCDNYSGNVASIEIPASSVYESTDNKTAEILENTEKYESFARPMLPVDVPENVIPVVDLSENVIPAEGKRKRSNSETSQHTNKKLNLDTAEEPRKQNTSQYDPNSDRLSQNLVAESTQSFSANGTTSQFETSSTATNNTNTNFIILSGFKHKSQIMRKQNTQQITVDNTPSQLETADTRKRARIAAICSDDDDDLFAFDSSATKRTRKGAEIKSKETLYAFGITRGKKKGSSHSSASKDPSQEEISQKITEKKMKFTLPALKPLEISSVGWLSRSLSNINLKREEEKYDPEKSSWINSIKNGFEVRAKSMKLRGLSFDESNKQTLKLNGKNFKAFAKKRNYSLQSSVITTVPAYVGFKSFCDF